jgi:hypothetical protein
MQELFDEHRTAGDLTRVMHPILDEWELVWNSLVKAQMIGARVITPT